MNVIVANKYKDMLSNLDIEVIKRIDGVFSADEIIHTFQNFFFNKMILDITAIENYQDIKNLPSTALQYYFLTGTHTLLFYLQAQFSVLH